MLPLLLLAVDDPESWASRAVVRWLLEEDPAELWPRRPPVELADEEEEVVE